MKKMKLFALMFLAGALIFSSCKKDDDEVAIAGPSVTFQNDNNSLEFDSNNPEGIDVNVDFTAEGEVSVFKLTFLNGDSIFDLTSTYKGDKSGTYRFVRSASLVGADLGQGQGTVEYVFTLTDKENNTKTATYTVTIASTGTPFTKEVTTGNFWHIEGPNPGAYDLDGDATVSSSGDVNTKSMINTDPATPNTDPSGFTGSWNSGNGTEFVKDNSFDYANATIEAATSAYANGTASGTVTNPVANDVYIAKKGSTYYVIKITAVTPEASKNNNGQITFSYKKN